jgi:hypothetical protein
MPRVLIRVNRDNHVEFFAGRNFRSAPYFISTKKVNPDEGGNYLREADFFLVEELDVKVMLEELAKANPGCNIEAFKMTQAGVCPPGAFTLKEVSKDGILPV